MHMPDDEPRHDRLLFFAAPWKDLRTSANRNPTPEFNEALIAGFYSKSLSSLIPASARI
jgi:hypothetical protein